MQENEEKKPKRVEAVLIDKRSPAHDYTQPLLHKVATDITADDSMFIPHYCEESASVGLKANLSESLRIQPRGVAVVDCGFSMKIPAGYRLTFEPIQSLSGKGLTVFPAIYKERVRVTVVNLGREIITINHGDCFAQVSIQPVYMFDWVLSTVSDKEGR